MRTPKATIFWRKEAERAMTVLPRYPNIVLRGNTIDGNAFEVLVATRRAFRVAGMVAKVMTAFTVEATSGDYANLMKTVGEFGNGNLFPAPLGARRRYRSKPIHGAATRRRAKAGTGRQAPSSLRHPAQKHGDAGHPCIPQRCPPARRADA